ncbi:MAG: adenine deaminase [Methanomicrobiales archaeon]|nr:adenine deaminase [Methanomicrobiales archaeon]
METGQPPMRNEHLIRVARGIVPADILFSNAERFNPITGAWEPGDFAVADGVVVGSGSFRAKTELNLKNRRVIPGLIDAHVHIESSLLCPPEFARLVSAHGTTTVIADPHEIANVCGADGISFMLSFREKLPLDMFVMLPSCVPATPLDIGGAVLDAADLAPFRDQDGVLGLGEMMNVPGVLAADPRVMEKLDLFPLVDGHAPLLSGKDLAAYIIAGIQSDHESTGLAEAEEKLSQGMFLFIREGSTEKNIGAIAPLISRLTCPRLSFATDDRHVDMLADEGHIDDCIRKALASGVELESALRMATLSPAERFRLDDRGALVPGRIADFCLLAPGSTFAVEKTFKRGRPVMAERGEPCSPVPGNFRCVAPQPADITLGGSGRASVIGLIPHQIVTEHLTVPIESGGIPDTERDILKAVVCNRYSSGRFGTGLVHGFGLGSGAIAGSVSHDAHNIVTVGVRDEDICRAVSRVISSGGGLVVVDGRNESFLSLECAGLMSVRPWEEVHEGLRRLIRHVERLGGNGDAFMHLSFLALTVIPHLRITDRGLFDADLFRDIPVFPGHQL